MNRFIEHYLEQINDNLEIINDLFIDECQKAIDKLKGEYRIDAGMGCFVIEKDGIGLYDDDIPKELRYLDKFWNKMVDDFSFYMTMEKIDNYTMKG